MAQAKIEIQKQSDSIQPNAATASNVSPSAPKPSYADVYTACDMHLLRVQTQIATLQSRGKDSRTPAENEKLQKLELGRANLDKMLKDINALHEDKKTPQSVHATLVEVLDSANNLLNSKKLEEYQKNFSNFQAHADQLSKHTNRSLRAIGITIGGVLAIAAAIALFVVAAPASVAIGAGAAAVVVSAYGMFGQSQTARKMNAFGAGASNLTEIADQPANNTGPKA